MKADRRQTLRGLLAATALAALPWPGSGARAAAPGMRAIPSTGEAIPAVGLGSWITFNVGNDPMLRDSSAEVIAAFVGAGGRMIDSSPMYGSAQEVIGDGLRRLGKQERLFAADKVWTSDGAEGPAQIEESRRRWGVPRFDLLQVHNLLAWEAHLDTLFAMKAAGRLRYAGITTSHGRPHDLVERIMAGQPLDFVQVTYNVVDRAVEDRILPLARERGIAVIVNRPFQQGRLTRRLAREPLPGWVAETGATTWAQAILRFILSHPAVTVAIPATTRADHAIENVAAAAGPMPDAALRERLAGAVRAL